MTKVASVRVDDISARCASKDSSVENAVFAKVSAPVRAALGMLQLSSSRLFFVS
jgi:hypothetical protein